MPHYAVLHVGLYKISALSTRLIDNTAEWTTLNLYRALSHKTRMICSFLVVVDFSCCVCICVVYWR